MDIAIIILISIISYFTIRYSYSQALLDNDFIINNKDYDHGQRLRSRINWGLPFTLIGIVVYGSILGIYSTFNEQYDNPITLFKGLLFISYIPALWSIFFRLFLNKLRDLPWWWLVSDKEDKSFSVYDRFFISIARTLTSTSLKKIKLGGILAYIFELSVLVTSFIFLI